MTGRTPNALIGLSTVIQQAVELTGARFGVQMFTESGTFVMPSLPAGVTSITVMAICIGGGGGGAGPSFSDQANNAGGTGGTTSFGALVSALGGSGATASVAGAGINAQGTQGWSLGEPQLGSSTLYPIIETLGPFQGGKGFLGIGSGGTSGRLTQRLASSAWATSPGANAGEVKTYFGAVTANQTVTIGAGGAAAMNTTSFSAGYAVGHKGDPGAVIVFYWW
jgi:hypothetical protein